MYDEHPDGKTPSFNNLVVEDNENGHLAGEEDDSTDPAPDDPEVELGETLNPGHLAMLLRGSGVSEDVVRSRGYQTVGTKAELKRLGFSDSQSNPPGLLIPLYSPAGEVANYQVRPDQPRIKDGKPVRYETPRGSRMVLDVHPWARGKLGDPTVPLFITEGVKKGDALVSCGLCAMALLGVWNWRGTNGHGGKIALPEWESVALNGRQVFIVFDSDVMHKHEVHAALVRIKGFLEGRGAVVAPIYLPAGEGGSKQGVDDFLVVGNSVDDLLALAATELRKPPREEEDEAPPVPYRETPHGLVWDKLTKEGTVPVLLANFTARITGDVVEDDGAEARRHFEVEADLRGRRTVFTVPSEAFSAMSWPTERLGAGAILYPGSGTRDHARAAIQMLSGDVPTRHVYSHVGWRKVDDEWFYLHAGGPIGSEGSLLTEVEVSLGDGRLGDYWLPEPPVDDELKEALRGSLRFLELAPPRIAVPLFAAVFRAPLGEMAPVDLSLFAVGPTGVFKTEITAMAQAFYGADFDGRNLPGNWASTANALEKQSFMVKDAVLTVDDFAPTGSTYDVQRYHRTADQLLRAQGNRAGRGRMRADTSLRSVYHPRGLIVSSGEDVPRGQSLRSRMAVLEVSPGDVDLDVLTEMQRAAAEGLLASAMSGYLRWLAPRVDDLKENLPERLREMRAMAAGAGTHARTPDTVASLGLGIEAFLWFAVETGAIIGARAEELWGNAWRALGEMAEAQSEHQAGEEPTRQFLDLLTSAIVGGYAHVAGVETGEEPDDAKRWGWRPKQDAELQPLGIRIGWLNEDGSLLLEPGAAYATAQRVARDQGTNLPVGQRALWKRLAEREFLASKDAARGRNTTRATIAGERKVVVHLIPGALSPSDPIGPNDPSPGRKGPSEPRKRAVPSPPEAETARENGPDPAENGPSGPKGPIGPFPGNGDAKRVERGVPFRLPDGKALLVDTEVGMQGLLTELQGADRVALDLETTGLDPREHRVRLLSLATEQGAWLVDCAEVDPRPLFPVLAQKTLLIHNALFDLGFLHEMGFEMGKGGGIVDTMLMSQLIGVEQTEDKEDE